MLSYRIHRHDTADDWVVFVHGAGGSSAIWFKQIRDFRNRFNILLLDLRGHGRSSDSDLIKRGYSLESISSDMLEVLDAEKIEAAHFVGVSLGTILMRKLLEIAPERVISMVMTGALTALTPWAKFLIAVGQGLRHIIPFRILYATFAWIIMPGKHAREARRVFRIEARKVTPAEFRRWLTILGEVRRTIHEWRTESGNRPILYVMGELDYMFMPPAKALSEQFDNTHCRIVARCGHVCNVEQPEEFNEAAIAFISEHAVRQ